MRTLVFSVFFAMLCVVCLSAQQPTGTPKPTDGVVKILTNLIQIDVTVTDEKGKIVTGLKPEDFEVFENGEKQPISSFSFSARDIASATANPGDQSPGGIGGPVTTLKPGEIRRTIAIVVDDLNLSFASVYYTRKALKKFVNEQMQPGDLVAIIRTGGGVGALQQFTSDKLLLFAAIDKIHWNPLGNGGTDTFARIESDAQDMSQRVIDEHNNLGINSDPANIRIIGRNRPNFATDKANNYNLTKNFNEFQEGVFAVGSLGSVRYVINGMKELPGRKMMMLFSDGIRINSDATKSRSSVVLGYLQELIDAANRSSVVVYTFDTKGLATLSIQASDSTFEIVEKYRDEKLAERFSNFRASQDGLVQLASQTGGKALLNSNNLNYGIQRALDEQGGYYLIGYTPDSDTFDPAKRKFNKLEVKVNQTGLKVSYRSGFFNSNGDAASGPALTVEQKLGNAIISPFALNEIPVSLNALYADDPADGAYIRSFLHIDAKTLTFTDDPDGSKKAKFDIVAVTFGDNGVPVESKEADYTIRAKGVTYQAMLKTGFVYVLVQPIKRPGIYQYRVALCDEGSGKIGSASQIVEVPDLSKQKLTVSSLAVENVSNTIWQSITQGKVGNAPGQMQVVSSLLYDTVLKQFHAGTVLRYGFEVYNAKSDGSEKPQLEWQTRILQNNKAVIEGTPIKLNASVQNDPKHSRVSGAIALKEGLPAGDYVLQVLVTDTQSKQSAVQVFPFEIVQ